MGGLGEVAVVDDHGVELISHGEALPCPEILVAGGGAQVIALGHGQELGVLLIGDTAGLGGADGHGDDLVHWQLGAAGDIAAQGDPQALVDHAADGANTGADVHIGVAAVDHHHAGVTNGGALALVGPDAVCHECVVLPKAVLVVCLPILAALGVQLLHPGDLVGALGQVGLDI